MNLIEELRLIEGKKKKEPFDYEAWAERMKNLTPEESARAFSSLGNPPDPDTSPDASYRSMYGSQQRGPTPGGEGGADTTKSHQPLAAPHSSKASVRRIVKGNPPLGTMPQPGEKFESDEAGQAASDYLKGRPAKKGKAKQNKLKFESRLLEALVSNEERLLEITSKNWSRRGHVKKMGGVKKALIAATLGAALGVGAGEAYKAHKGGKKEPQRTHQTQKQTPGHSGRGVSADEDEIGDSSKDYKGPYDPKAKGPTGQTGPHPKSLGKGRVTKDSGL